MVKKKEFKVAVAGYGHVGKDTVKTIIENNAIMEKRTGIKLTIKTIFSRNIDKVKDDKFLDKVEIKTKDLNDILNDDDIDIVIEVLGGMDTAKELLMKVKKPVVTANKALLANCFGELIKDRKTDIAFEASVAGAIPIIKAMKESLVSDRMENVYGILNGTCNYILTQMKECGVSFEEALKEAQKLGGDCLVTGDLKFHTALDSGIVVFDIGHFESEILILPVFASIIGKGVEIVFAKEKSPFIKL